MTNKKTKTKKKTCTHARKKKKKKTLKIVDKKNSSTVVDKDKDKDVHTYKNIESELVTDLETQLTIADKLRNSHHADSQRVTWAAFTILAICLDTLYLPGFPDVNNVFILTE